MGSNFEVGDELIIVNDYSADNTADILDGLKEKYPAIKLIDHARNKGGGAARNTAVEHAKHELLFCLDADNVLAPSSIRPLKNFLTKNNADVASFQYQHYFLEDKNTPEYTWSLPYGEIPLSTFLHGENTPGQHGNYLFTKESWKNAKGYSEGSGALDTWTFGLRQAITGAKIMVLKDTFYYHRLDPQNSYWMRDAESNLWSVSIKATIALMPFIDIIDEKFLKYMLGKGRYSWFHNLKNKPLILVKKDSKTGFYNEMHKKIVKFIYPKPSIWQRAVRKLKRGLKLK